MKLDEIIKSYLMQNVVTEEEVKEKLIYKLLVYLGYAEEFISAEFAIHSYKGRKYDRVKFSDYLVFDNKDFNNHREKEEVDWVYEHSLLVFETKSPSESIDCEGQAMYYNCWTKSVAYLVSNGKEIKGYFYVPYKQDQLVLNCSIEELNNNIIDLLKFSYSDIIKIKTKDQKLMKQEIYDFTQYKYDNLNFFKENLEKYIERKYIKNDTNQIVDDVEILKNENDKVLISGPSGEGKTTVLKKLFCTVCEQYYPKVPIYISLSLYGIRYNDIYEIVLSELRNYDDIIDITKVKAIIETYNIVLFIDGFEEMDSCYRTCFVDDLKKIIKLSNIKTVLAMRDYENVYEFDSIFDKYMIKKFDIDEICEISKKASNGKKILYEYMIPENIKDIICIPLFLNMILDSCSETFIINKTIYKIIRKYIDKNFDILIINKVEKNLLYKIFTEFAKSIIEHKDKDIQEIIGEMGGIYDVEQYLLLLLKTRMLVCVGYDYSFSHLVLAEYFYAEYLAKIDIANIINWIKNDASSLEHSGIVLYLASILYENCNEKFESFVDYFENNDYDFYIKLLNNKTIIEKNEFLSTLDSHTYLSSLLKSYKNIVISFFSGIKTNFIGFKFSDTYVTIAGYIGFDTRMLYFTIFSSKNKNSIFSFNNPKDYANFINCNRDSILFSNGEMSEHYHNLKLSLLGKDSYREIAFSTIKSQLGDIIENQSINYISKYLYCEYIDEYVNKVFNKFGIDVSFKSHTGDEILKLCDLYSNEHNIKKIRDHILNKKEYLVDAKDFLLLKNDIYPDTPYYPEEQYSKATFKENISRVLKYSDFAMNDYFMACSQNKKIKYYTYIASIKYVNNKPKAIMYLKYESNEEKCIFLDDNIELPFLDFKQYVESLGYEINDKITYRVSLLMGFVNCSSVRKRFYDLLKESLKI